MKERACRVCGCTDDDCNQCIAALGFACHWVEWNLCSRCAPPSWRVFYAVRLDSGMIALTEQINTVKAYSIKQALSNAREYYQSHVAVMSLVPLFIQARLS